MPYVNMDASLSGLGCFECFVIWLRAMLRDIALLGLRTLRVKIKFFR